MSPRKFSPAEWLRWLLAWAEKHPARAGALGGWYQQFASGIVTLAFIPLIRHRLGDVEAGIWFSFQGLSAAVGLADFGIGFVLARQIAYSLHAEGAPAAGDFLHLSQGWAGVRDVLAAARIIFYRMIWVSVAIIGGLYEIVVTKGHLHVASESWMRTTWYLLGASMILQLRMRRDQSLLEGLGQVHVCRLILGTYQFFVGLAVIGGLLIFGKLVAMAFCVLVSTLACVAVMRWLAVRAAGNQIDWEARPPEGLVSQLWRVSAPMGVVNTSSFLISGAQIPLIGVVLGAELVAPFFAAQRIGSMLNAAVLQIVGPQLPYFTREIAAGRRGEAARRMQNIVSRMGAIIIAANLSFFLLSPWVARIWLHGRSYADGLTLGLMALDYALLSISVVWAQFVLASGKNPFTWTTLASGLLTLGGCWILARMFGVAGIPMGGLLAGLATNYWFAPWQGWRWLREQNGKGVEKAGVA